MQLPRLQAITSLYPKLRIAIVGDFCLDRYFEIDPRKNEISIETGLPVYNVTNVRCQPGAAGTILNNLVSLGIGQIFAVGFCGEDGEGWELRRALQAKSGVRLDYFLATAQRRTFTYSKPLLLEPGKPPVELNRLDTKNWTTTPPTLMEFLQQATLRLSQLVDAVILMDQVDVPETGVVTSNLLQTVESIAASRPDLLILADSRRGLRGFPKVTFKMNGAELGRFVQKDPITELESVRREAAALAQKQGQKVFITISEQGIVGASPEGEVEHIPALPVRGPIDIVGAGDAVTANLTAALAAGATLKESLQIAMLASSLVIHQLGTTGTASVPELQSLMASLD